MANKVIPKAFPESPVIDNTEALGLFIRAQRTQHGLVINETAKMLNVSVDLLSGLENGSRNVGIDKVLHILAGLGLKMSICTKKQLHYVINPAFDKYNEEKKNLQVQFIGNSDELNL
jgi:transcriptional regulator with XRE-family HTH domain